jgi:Tfp pilus assembly pilus retraction ATPase PilT
MQAGQKYGMQTMNQALAVAVVNRLVTHEEALTRSSDVDELQKMLGSPSHSH